MYNINAHRDSRGENKYRRKFKASKWPLKSKAMLEACIEAMKYSEIFILEIMA